MGAHRPCILIITTVPVVNYLSAVYYGMHEGSLHPETSSREVIIKHSEGGEEASELSGLHTFLTYSLLAPFYFHLLLHTSAETLGPLPGGSISCMCSSILSLGKANERVAEWISFGDDDSTLASIFVLVSSPASFAIHPFSCLCRSASARGPQTCAGPHTLCSQHPLKCPALSTDTI